MKTPAPSVVNHNGLFGVMGACGSTFVGVINAEEAYMKAIDKQRFAPMLQGQMGEIAKGGKGGSKGPPGLPGKR